MKLCHLNSFYLFQWECKADMDNSYRFGKVEVYCEGYDYPEDPYILRGSCGVSGIGPDRQNTSVDNWE